MTSIPEERRRLADIGLVLRLREQWGARFNYTTPRSVIEPATQAFCHISVTNPDAYSSNDGHWRAIEKIGISRFGSTGISYNGGILPGGELYEGQPWGRRGAHSVNTYERATCATSGCPSRGSSITAPDWNNNYPGRALVFARNVDDPVTDADVDAAAQYWAGYKLAGLLTSSAKIHGHRCLSAKDCPGGKVWARMDDIVDLTATYVRTGLPGTTPEPSPSLEGSDMLVIQQANRDTVWYIEGGVRRHIRTVPLRDQLVALPGVAYDRDARISSELLTAWTTQGDDIGEVPEVPAEPPPA